MNSSDQPQFKITNLNDEASLALSEETGRLILQSALMKYIATLSDQEVTAFEEFLEKNLDTEDFLSLVQTTHPDFYQFLEEETAALQQEISTFTGSIFK